MSLIDRFLFWFFESKIEDIFAYSFKIGFWSSLNNPSTTPFLDDISVSYDEWKKLVKNKGISYKKKDFR